MRTIEVNIYKFEELSEQAKGNAKYAFRDMIQEDRNREFNDIATELIEEVFPDTNDLRYSLGYSQGDGISFRFRGNLEDIRKVFIKVKDFAQKEDSETHALDDFIRRIQAVNGYHMEDALKAIDNVAKTFPNCYNDYDVYMVDLPSANRYCNRNTRDVTTELYELGELENDAIQRAFIYADIKTILTASKEVFMTACYFLEQLGYEIIYEDITDEYMVELCESNEYEFYDTGEQF